MHEFQNVGPVICLHNFQVTRRGQKYTFCVFVRLNIIFQHPVAIAHRQHRNNRPSPWIHEHIHGTTKEYN
jgi:hypothetical protein